VPDVLASILLSVELNDFTPEPQIVTSPAPLMTSFGGFHSLAPADIATIYDITPLYQAGIDGTGQTIAIVGQSRMSVADFNAFRTRFNLPGKVPQAILVPGSPQPPTSTTFAMEAALDLEWAGAVAPGADLVFVYGSNAFQAARYAIDQNIAPVLSVSFGACESALGLGSLVSYEQTAQQANAQGITWVNAAGDAGAAGCDPNGYPMAQNGLAVAFPSSIPEVTAVGGTQFDEVSDGGTYWNSQNDANSGSALSYIPERTWNESAVYSGLVAGGGGMSGFYPKPAWQAGPGVPADGMRDVPDVALTAAVTHDAYAMNYNGGTTTVGGTSAATPVFAGILALVNQYLQSTGIQAQSRLGNVNPVLYQLARNNPSVFHDISTGGNQVPCAAGSPNCTSATLGYQASSNYDLATGLGSPDVLNLVHQWSSQVPHTSQVVVSANQNPVYKQAPDRNGYSWKIGLTLTEEGGIPTTLTDFTIDGKSYLSLFSRTAIPALGSLSSTIGFANLNVPATLVFGFAGIDASGTIWSRSISVPFLSTAATPTITGVANGFSFDQAYAPGMFVSVFGTNLAAASQGTAAVPLESYFGGLTASIGSNLCPIFYVSPNQVNLQIPYEVQPGAATLMISNSVGSASYSLQISAAAPGIAQDASHALVPNPSGSRGQSYALFMTGDGRVSPAVADGSTPRSTISPSPLLGVTVTIGGVQAPIQFLGIPSWAIGMTQINFQVPTTAPMGTQQVVVTVGTAASSPVNFTVLP
jgi:uncharacterized protein (TIGR03437 family)